MDALFPTFIGAFLGFLSAISVQWIWAVFDNAKIRGSLASSLIHECQGNLERLTMAMGGDSAYVQAHDRAAWSMVLSSGGLRHFNQDRFIQMAADAYYRMEVLEKWDQLRLYALVLSDVPNRTRDMLDTIVDECRTNALASLRTLLEEQQS